MNKELREAVAVKFREMTAAEVLERQAVTWEGLADAAISIIRPAVLEEAAKVADAERMTGVPPLFQWTQREIEIAEATCKVTSQSIASTIRALAKEGE